MALNIIENYLTKSDCYNSGGRITPIGIQIHSIGTAQSKSKAVADYWNQPGIQACVHYAVDAETEGKVLQLLPENYRSWADAGFGNNNLITIEGMESNYMKYTSGANYTVTNETNFNADIRRAYNGLVLLCAKLCVEFGWYPFTMLPNGLYIISSHDEGRLAGVSSAHVDPTHVWSRLGYTMNGFRSDVAGAISSEDMYRVGTGWSNGKCKNQHGAFGILDNAKRDADTTAKENNKTYYVFDSSGSKVYTAAASSFDPYQVRVSITGLRIRTGPGLGYTTVGFCPVGVYTITQAEKADSYNWGRLKSGTGWIALEYTEKL